MARRIEPDDPQEKRDEYTILVQTGIQALMSDALRQSNSPEAKAHTLAAFTLRLANAISLRDKIPAGHTALHAATDVLDFVFNWRCADRDEPDREWLPDFRAVRRRGKRGAWMEMQTRGEFLAEIGPVYVRVGGEWILEREEFENLPFEDTATLEILSSIRRLTQVSITQINRKVPFLSEQELRRRLKKLEADGWLRITNDKREPSCVATEKLLATDVNRPHTPEPAPRALSPTEKYHARTRAARIERMAEIHRMPDARKILKAIKRNGPMQLKELNPLVSHLERLALRRFMMGLREAGWIECAGAGGGAAWVGTQKLVDTGG